MIIKLFQSLFFDLKCTRTANLSNLEPSTSLNPRNQMWLYLRDALRGNAEAQYQLGLSYLNGELGLDRNYQIAEKWLNQSANAGNENAKRTLLQAYSLLAFS